MTCVICIATRSLTTHQIWRQSAQLFLSYELATHFDTLHAARATRQADPPNEPNLVAVIFLMGLPASENRLDLECIVFGDISVSKT